MGESDRVYKIMHGIEKMGRETFFPSPRTLGHPMKSLCSRFRREKRRRYFTQSN